MRADGKRLKKADPMYTVASHIMTKRSDSMNMVTIDIPYDPLHDYINAKRKDGVNISHMAVIISAYLRTAAEFPELNRFIVIKRAYARNEYAVGMVVLKSGSTDHGTMSKIYFENTDTIFQVNEKINKFVEENRNTPENNGTEKIIKVLLSIPGLLTFGVPFLMFLDK